MVEEGSTIIGGDSEARKSGYTLDDMRKMQQAEAPRNFAYHLAFLRDKYRGSAEEWGAALGVDEEEYRQLEAAQHDGLPTRETIYEWANHLPIHRGEMLDLSIAAEWDFSQHTQEETIHIFKKGMEAIVQDMQNQPQPTLREKISLSLAILKADVYDKAARQNEEKARRRKDKRRK